MARPFVLDTGDMERWGVELRLFIAKEKRRFAKANMETTFERIIKAQLTGDTEENNQLVCKVQNINQNEVKTLEDYFNRLVDKCSDSEQHSILEESFRKGLKSCRRSIFGSSGDQIEPMCMFCGHHYYSQQEELLNRLAQAPFGGAVNYPIEAGNNTGPEPNHFANQQQPESQAQPVARVCEEEPVIVVDDQNDPPGTGTEPSSLPTPPQSISCTPDLPANLFFNQPNKAAQARPEQSNQPQVQQKQSEEPQPQPREEVRNDPPEPQTPPLTMEQLQRITSAELARRLSQLEDTRNAVSNPRQASRPIQDEPQPTTEPTTATTLNTANNVQSNGQVQSDGATSASSTNASNNDNLVSPSSTDDEEDEDDRSIRLQVVTDVEPNTPEDSMAEWFNDSQEIQDNSYHSAAVKRFISETGERSKKFAAEGPMTSSPFSSRSVKPIKNGKLKTNNGKTRAKGGKAEPSNSSIEAMKKSASVWKLETRAQQQVREAQATGGGDIAATTASASYVPTASQPVGPTGATSGVSSQSPRVTFKRQEEVRQFSRFDTDRLVDAAAAASPLAQSTPIQNRTVSSSQPVGSGSRVKTKRRPRRNN